MLGIEIDTVAISKLAGAIEFGLAQIDQERLIAAAFAPYEVEKYGAIILACTHYPLALAAFTKVLGSVPLYDPAEAVAERVEKYFWPREDGDGKLRFLVSKETEQFHARVAELSPDATYTIEVVE
jgi:glutamate racemase